jgi:hypothetical protein
VRDFLVAYFRTHSEAVNSAEKLLAHGLQRDRISIHVPGEEATELESVGALSKIPPEWPFSGGSTILSVVLKRHASVDDVCLVLKDAGAYLIDVTEQTTMPEYPAQEALSAPPCLSAE